MFSVLFKTYLRGQLSTNMVLLDLKLPCEPLKSTSMFLKNKSLFVPGSLYNVNLPALSLHLIVLQESYPRMRKGYPPSRNR